MIAKTDIFTFKVHISLTCSQMKNHMFIMIRNTIYFKCVFLKSIYFKTQFSYSFFAFH